jgi:hypothetical protein
MGRKAATLWHATFSIAAGVLYFFFVLPRWPELMGETSHTLGIALRIVTGVVIALAALPVVFTLLRTRQPEYGTPQLALTLRTWSTVAHVLAGALIAGTAISEIWLSLDAAGSWLFGIYGAAAAVAVLGIFGFYLSFIAELPPPPPKPLKPKKEKQRRLRRKRGEKPTAEAESAEAEATEATEAEGADHAETAPQEPVATAAKPAESENAEPENTESESTKTENTTVETPRDGLRNRRPSGKTSGAHRRKRSRRGVTRPVDS